MLEKETYEGKKLRLELKTAPETFHLRYLQDQNTALCQELKDTQEQIRRILRWIRESFPQEREKMELRLEDSARDMGLQIKQFQGGMKSHQKEQIQRLQFLESKIQNLEERLCEQEQGKQKFKDLLERQQQQFLQYQNYVDKLRHLIHCQEEQLLLYKSYLKEMKSL